MKARTIFSALLGGMLVAGCGISAPVSTSSQTQTPVQRKAPAPQSTNTGTASSKVELAFVQPEVDASQYASAQELIQKMEQNPSAMSRNEFFAASKAYSPGSAGFNKVYETAVKYFPNDETVNLNRASALMQAGDTAGAKPYLDKAGESADAVYSRGVWYFKRGNVQQAVPYFRKADEMGFPKASAAIRAIATAR